MRGVLKPLFESPKPYTYIYNHPYVCALGQVPYPQNSAGTPLATKDGGSDYEIRNTPIRTFIAHYVSNDKVAHFGYDIRNLRPYSTIFVAIYARPYFREGLRRPISASRGEITIFVRFYASHKEILPISLQFYYPSIVLPSCDFTYVNSQSQPFDSSHSPLSAVLSTQLNQSLLLAFSRCVGNGPPMC